LKLSRLLRIPIIWRYLLGHYLKVLGFCVVAFIAILLTTRLDEIARFASLGAEGNFIWLFALYQIPYILPIAIPISCLISSIILFQKLSTTYELTALRACGLALRQIIGPILIAGAYLALFNLYIVSEVATQSHLQTKQLEHKLRSINPLLLLQNAQLLKMKGVCASVLGSSRPGESVSDVVLAMNNKHGRRLNLLIVQDLHNNEEVISGSGFTLISGMGSDDLNRYDHLMIENIEQTTTPMREFSRILKKEGWKLNHDHLRLPLLLVRTHEEYQKLRAGKEDHLPASELHPIRRKFNSCLSEISRRFSVAIAAFTFTLMGAAYGMSISRNRSKRGIIWVIGLAAMYLSAFFFAKGIDHLFVLSTLLYSVPHLIILVLSIRTLTRVTRGIE